MAGMGAPPDARWSQAFAEAEWIRERLTAFDTNRVPPAVPGGFSSFRVGSIVPSGFEAYARVLHPAVGFAPGEGPPVRWRDVAAWSGRPIGRETQFHSIALPPERPAGEAPFAGRSPQIGAPCSPDALGTAALLATGEATVTTSIGSVRFYLDRPERSRPGRLRYGDRGWSSVGRPADEAALRRTVSDYLTHAVIGLVGQ
jgi:hypothetical protein